MNLLLLGNGFDIYHKLPTKYENFLHTIEFLKKSYNSDMKTIGDVFSNSLLQNEDKFIANCYEEHKEVYDKITLNLDLIEKIIEISKTNLWLNYFINSFNRDIGWIDFEKEISFVIHNLYDFFSSNQSIYISFHENTSKYHIVNKFNFFLKDNNSGFGVGKNKTFKDEYIYEYPLGSGVKLINKENIILKLNQELNEFSEMLKLYMKIFVDDTLDLILKESKFKKCSAISCIDKVISFNYTNTYEILYKGNEVFHIHGNLNKNIILGINPDSFDNIDSIDTDFVCFKKYYQRVKYNTDNEYLRCLRTIENRENSMMIMGHSLDATDQDILVELFRIMNEIIILYHSEDAKESYIKNLIHIFGKEEFDKIRRNGNVQFLPLDMDFTEFNILRSENQYKEKMKDIRKKISKNLQKVIS